MAPKNDHFLRIKAAAGSEKGSSQNPFNYMKSTIHGEHDRPIKILKFSIIGCERTLFLRQKALNNSEKDKAAVIFV